MKKTLLIDPARSEIRRLCTRDSSFLRIHAAHVGALAVKRAGVAGRPLGMADLSPVPDEIDMQWIDPIWRYRFGKKGMCRISAHFRADQAQASGGSPDMGIDWEGRSVKVKHQNAGGGLRPYPWQSAQIGQSIPGRPAGKFIRKKRCERACAALFLLLLGEGM